MTTFFSSSFKLSLARLSLFPSVQFPAAAAAHAPTGEERDAARHHPRDALGDQDRAVQRGAGEVVHLPRAADVHGRGAQATGVHRRRRAHRADPRPAALRATTRFISAWCFALPLCLVQSMGFLVVPLTSVVVWALFGLREIGSLIENPFQRSLQLRIVSDSIRSDVNRILLEGSTGSTLPPELRA